MPSTEAFAELLDVVSEATLVLERDGVVRVANLAAARLLGRARAELVGAPAEALLGEAAALGLEATATPMPGLGDGVSVLSLRDLREQRQRARDAELAAERIHTLMELARVGAWEVNNPLAAVMANVDFTLRALSGDELGGEISCESHVGVGTTFRVILTAAAPTAVAEAAMALPVLAAPRRGRVLIVDDEPLLVAAAERVLQDEHEVTVTTSAVQALASIRAGARYDVILCDLMMPQMTGMDLHAELAQSDPQQAARMVFLTGGVFTPRARSFIEDRRRQCLEKPFAIETLRAAVNGRLALAD